MPRLAPEQSPPLYVQRISKSLHTQFQSSLATPASACNSMRKSLPLGAFATLDGRHEMLILRPLRFPPGRIFSRDLELANRNHMTSLSRDRLSRNVGEANDLNYSSTM